MTIILTSGSLKNYYRDEISDDANENNAANNRVNNNKTKTSKSFKDKIDWEHTKW